MRQTFVSMLEQIPNITQVCQYMIASLDQIASYHQARAKPKNTFYGRIFLIKVPDFIVGSTLLHTSFINEPPRRKRARY